MISYQEFDIHSGIMVLLTFIFAVEHQTDEEFTKVCATRTVPAIDDNGFKLFERWKLFLN